METPKSKSPVWVSMASILMIIAIFLFGLYAPRGWNWAIVMFLMIVFISLIGWLITGRFSGIFINERNKMTLSRFQLVIWTLIVLSAFLTIALERISAGVGSPLDIAIPQQLWALLGISTTSLVGSPLILSTKIPKKLTKSDSREEAIKLIKKENDHNKLNILSAAEDAKATVAKATTTTIDQAKADAAGKVAAAEHLIAQKEEIVKKFGILASNEKPEDAKFSDMFTGDEKGNNDFVDMAKVQMFLFTLIIAFSYMVLLINLIMTTKPSDLNSFPVLTDSVVALLGISSAGYLTNKTYDKTPTQK
jgi:hypothetical protein